MKNIKNIRVSIVKWKVLYLLFFIAFTFSCNKNNMQQNVISYLTSDSIQFWDAYNYSGDVRLSYSFDKSGNCETYALGIDGSRRIYVFDSIPDDYGICNRWKLNNDGTLNIMCEDNYKIISRNKDSMVLKKLNNPGLNWTRTFYKAKGDLNIDEKELRWRDSIIEARREQQKIYEKKIKSGEIKVVTEKADPVN